MMPKLFRKAVSFFPEKRIVALALAAGGLGALGHAPWSLWMIAMVGFTLMCWLLLRASTWQETSWIGWLSGTGYFAIALFWIVEPFLVDIGRHGWMAPFALFLMASGLALLWALAAAMAGQFKSPVLRSIAIAASFATIEFLRSILFTGFPWALISYIWSEHPILQSAAYVGPFFLVGITLLISGLMALSFLTKRVVPAFVSLLLIGGIWVFSSFSLERAPQTLSENTVRLVQPNAAQHLKWQSDMIPKFFNAQLEMTKGAKEAGVDLVIWPETAVGYRLNQTPEAIAWIKQTANGVPVLFGGNAVVDDKFRNTLAHMGPSGTIDDWYYKHHLVPFGEYIPFGDLLSRWGIRGLAARDGAGYDVGPGPQLIEVAGIGAVLPLICYELIFPRYTASDPRADLILQVTNDAWFGEISGPYQHLAQAKFRAVEQGLPLVRVANTGVSAVIDGQGRIVGQIALGRAGYLDVALPKTGARTVYSKTGDLPWVVLLLAILGGLFLIQRIGRGHEKHA